MPGFPTGATGLEPGNEIVDEARDEHLSSESTARDAHCVVDGRPAEAMGLVQCIAAHRTPECGGLLCLRADGVMVVACG